MVKIRREQVIRRSVSFPDAVYKEIQRQAKAKPHYTENAIIIDLVEVGIGAYQENERADRRRESAGRKIV
jgi:hypothetical protein